MANEPRNTKGIRPVSKPGHALTLLNAVNTTGAGTAVDLGGAFTNFGLVMFRATTGTSGGSTKPSLRIQGSLNAQSTAAKWFTIGAATRNPTAAGTLAALTSTAAVTAIRASINSFTTSGGANPDKVKTTVIVAPYGV